LIECVSTYSKVNQCHLITIIINTLLNTVRPKAELIIQKNTTRILIEARDGYFLGLVLFKS